MSSSGIPAAPSPPIPGGLLEGWELVRRRTPPRYWLHILLLLLTLGSTTMVGAGLNRAFRAGEPFRVEADLAALAHALRDPGYFLSGLPFSLTLLAILLAHEMGHYVACVRYGVDASLPYFLPAPTLIGTLGAFIRIRSPIYSKRILFDIGIAGPIAGFLCLLPPLIAGVALSRIQPGVSQQGDLVFGTPLILRALEMAFFPGVASGDLALHPVGRAAWAGLLATALNLLPIGQLDGGHIVYAFLGERTRWFSRAMLAALAVAALFFSGYPLMWLIWAVLLLVFGMRHPVIYDPRPVGPARERLAGLALAIFLVSFTLTPVLPKLD